MSKGNSHLFLNTKGAVRMSNGKNYNEANSISIKDVDNIIISEDHSIPKDSTKNTVIIKKKNSRTISERYYDENGHAYLDIDYTDHGNSERHPVVPHEHIIEYGDNGTFNRHKWRKIQNGTKRTRRATY